MANHPQSMTRIRPRHSQAHRWLDDLLTAAHNDQREYVLEGILQDFRPETYTTRQNGSSVQHKGRFADGSALDLWMYRDTEGHFGVEGYSVATAAEQLEQAIALARAEAKDRAQAGAAPEATPAETAPCAAYVWRDRLVAAEGNDTRWNEEQIKEFGRGAAVANTVAEIHARYTPESAWRRAIAEDPLRPDEKGGIVHDGIFPDGSNLSFRTYLGEQGEMRLCQRYIHATPDTTRMTTAEFLETIPAGKARETAAYMLGSLEELLQKKRESWDHMGPTARYAELERRGMIRSARTLY